MHFAGTNRGTKVLLNVFSVAPKFDSTKLAAVITRGALTLAWACALAFVATRPAQAQTETVLYDFPCSPTECANGDNPASSLTADSAGNLYGTTVSGGTNIAGVAFELTANGELNVLYNFCSASNCTDGENPYSNLIFDHSGNLYGVTYLGGAHGYGTVFELSPSTAGKPWSETVLYSFCDCGDGSYPFIGGLLFDPEGNLYGTAKVGVATGVGGVFELSPEPKGGCSSGTNTGNGWCEKIIYSNVTDAFYGLTMSSAGVIFGNSSIEAFELTPNGSGGWNPTVVQTFPSNDGGGTPAFDRDGNWYGTTAVEGTDGDGSVWKLTPVTTGPNKGTWTETTIYSFTGGNNGKSPIGGVVLDSAGNIYGMTQYGGEYDCGTVWKLSKGTHKFKTLWNFNYTDGGFCVETAYGGLNSMIVFKDKLYGMTFTGGGEGTGVVFEVDPSAAATKTTLTSSPNPSTSGESVTFTALVKPAPPNGETVLFRNGTTVLGSGTLTGGTAMFSYSTLPVGTNSITAVYGGDQNLLGSKSKVLKQVVSQ